MEGDDELLNVASPVPDVTYPVDGCTNVIIPGSLREEACEVLFQMVSLKSLIGSMSGIFYSINVLFGRLLFIDYRLCLAPIDIFIF